MTASGSAATTKCDETVLLFLCNKTGQPYKILNTCRTELIKVFLRPDLVAAVPTTMYHVERVLGHGNTLLYPYWTRPSARTVKPDILVRNYFVVENTFKDVKLIFFK